MKNRLSHTFLLTLLVTVALLALHELPTLRVGNTPLRRVDVLADIRPVRVEETVHPADSDTLVLPPPPPRPAFVDTCRAGITCIEDYADSVGTGGMRHFYEAVAGRHALGRPVRIAYFGDSFIEADIFTGDLRAMLQEKYGGCGVGYVPITTPFSGFRPTVRQEFSGWESHSVTDSIGFRRALQDLSGHYFIPRSGAEVTLSGQRKYASRLDTCEVSSIYFVTTDSLYLTARLNGGTERQWTVGGDSVLQTVSVEGRIGKVRWKVDRCDSVARFFAATMESASGIVLDNFSIRGGNGTQLEHIPLKIWKEYHRLRPYDLVVLQYGLNVASEKVRNYSYYTDRLEKVVERLQTVFPEASVLVVGVGDRDVKDEETGELRTMSGIPALVRYQQAVAVRCHAAFWNLFEAMGGEGSMATLVDSQPAMANRDYTHINFRGGRHLASLLFEALVYGQEQYEKRKAYESVP